MKKASGHAPHAAYAVLTVGDVVMKTGAQAGESVKWEAPFELRANDCGEGVLRLEVKEKHSHMTMSLGLLGKDAVLGELELPLRKLHTTGRKTETLPLQKSSSATITITYEVKEV